MDRESFDAARRFVDTSFGKIAFVEQGEGPVAVFCHAAVLNGYQWRDVLDGCASVRRVIAVDHMGHGHTRARPDARVDFAGHAQMLTELLDGLGVDRVDLVGNDSGGAIAQTFAAHQPHRVRSLALANCDARDSSPPPSLLPLLEIARRGAIKETWRGLLGNIEFARAPPLAALYQDPHTMTEDNLDAYLAPVVADEATVRTLERFLSTLEVDQLAPIEPQLRDLGVPTLIAWGTADTTFDLKLAYWLAETIPGARPVVEIDDGKLLWPEERPDRLAELLVEHWTAAE